MGGRERGERREGERGRRLNTQEQVWDAWWG